MTKKYFERIATLVAILFFFALPTMAQRYVDKIDRGLVAVPAAQGNLVSWRIFGEEYYDVTYNLYINGTLAAENLTVSNYNDTSGNAATTYQVAAVVRGKEQEKCAAITRWDALDSTGGIKIPVKDMTGRDGTNTNSHYTLNDISLGDLTGDGVVEFIVKRPCDLQLDTSQSNCFEALDAYDRFGTRLWWIDMGPNMCSGPDEQWDCIAYDWDLDGKAEVLLRGADNMIIHSANGDYQIGDMTVDTRGTVLSGSQSYTNQGAEYLLYLNGETGEPYAIGDGDTPYWIDYPNPRGEVLNNSSNWGDNYGHRATKHYFGAPYLDGRHPSIFLGRGCYTKHLFKAFDVDPTTHKLTQRWAWECTDSSSEWYGNGFHNFAIADVDWDGKDEIVFGSMIIDDSGNGLCTTGLGHGDAQHCSNFDPYRHGQQQFTCCEDNPNMQYYDATTGEMFYRSVGTDDDGRCLMGNFTNDYPGSVGRSTNTGWIGATSHKVIDGLNGDSFIDWADLNQRIYWDGDLLDEYFDSPGTEKEGRIYKAGSGTMYMFSSSLCANGSKNDPGAIADIFGDWREELVMRSNDDKYILVYTTPVYTEYALPTLWHDHQYRNSIVWQSVGYNQPPHKSYFVGEMEGITIAPPPLIMTDRTEVSDGGTIGTTDDHLIVCEWNDTHINITDGASPYMVTFYIPSNVTGNAASNAKSAVDPTYEYYTCNVTGGALTGSTRVVKQGDGILTLPTANMTYTGETNIWAGTLNFDGSMPNSPLWLNRFAELNSDGGEFKSIAADYAAIIRPGGEGKIGTITVGDLSLGFGSHIEFDVDCSTLSSDQVNITNLTIEAMTGSAWENYGPEYLTPVFNIYATNTSDGDLVDEGTYVLGTVGTVTGNISDIKVVGITGRKKSLAVENGQLLLIVEGVRAATTIYWTGAENASWNYASNANFVDEDGAEEIFVTGDIVNFTDDGQQLSVSLAEELDPSAVIVNSSSNYTFEGTGILVGDMSLTKQGSGRLTISNDNTYTGTTTISGGTLRVSSLSSSTQAAGNLGAVNSSPIVIENGATLQTTAAVTMGTPIEAKGDEGGILNLGADFAMNAIISGTVIDKQGSGAMTINKKNTVDTLAITRGNVEILSGGTPGSTVEFRGGSLYDDAQNTSHAINVPDGKSGTWYLTETYYTEYANKLTGSGTLTIIPRNTVNRVRLAGDWSNFYGTVKHTTSSIVLPLKTSTNMPHLTLDIASNCEVSNAGSSSTSGRTLQIGAVTGQGYLREYFSDFNSQASIANTTTTWKIGNDDGNDFTFPGHIIDSGTNKCAFTKVGSCKMTMTGSSSLQGAVTVSEGELYLNSSGSNVMLGTGALTIDEGAILSGKGLLANSSTSVNGVLCCGARDASDPTWGAGTPGVFQFSGNDIVVHSVLEVHINNSTTTVLTDVGTLTLNGELKIKGNITGLSVGDEVKIIDAATIKIGSNLGISPYCQPNNGEFMWDTSRLDEGLLVVAAISEGITNINAPELDDATIYTLQGVKLDTRPTRTGVYIVNGVKTVLR